MVAQRRSAVLWTAARQLTNFAAMKTRTAFLAALGALSLVLTSNAANWPAWRGPDGQGTVPEKNLPARWSATENIRW